MILVGDVIEKLETLEPQSVQTCVTSPPYWGLRDYGVEGQLGLEKTPQEFVANMVEVFRGVRRVLRDDGTCWLNIGDSYAQSEIRNRNGNTKYLDRPDFAAGTNQSGRKLNHGLKPKDLCLIPERLAIALQDDGWWIRSRIAWCKKSSMPESVTDRPTSAWEHIWLLTKSARYYYDAEAVKTSNGANLRNYWVLGPEPYPEAHFATFPSEIPRRCIKAGSRPRDTVLDPIHGSGTTAAVAQELDRAWAGVELNPEYAALAEKRIAKVGAPQIGLSI